jgi:O-succinylbenzoic acid--CoA ligase
VVTTYGATETCGGCIYDDRPFTGTTVEFVGDEPGRIAITGPTVAKRYRDGGTELADRRWLSNDLGRWRLGRLELLGRVDDLVKVGGSMIALPLIARQLKALAGAQDIAVLARDDQEWGHVPVVFVVGCDAPDTTLRQFAAAALGRGSVPMDIVRIDALPLLPNGKLDRQTLLTMVR